MVQSTSSQAKVFQETREKDEFRGRASLQRRADGKGNSCLSKNETKEAIQKLGSLATDPDHLGHFL